MAEMEHALLSASAASRWIHCPPSARLGEQFEDITTGYAEEGTLAHAVGELKLRKLFTDQAMTERAFKTQLNKLKKKGLYQDEMGRHTDSYADYVQQIAFSYVTTPYVAVEKQVKYGHIAPEGFGTADCAILAGNDCHVIDFKYGKGVPVSAEGNPQLGLYAVGIIKTYGLFYPIEKVILHVVQPRLNNFSKWETTLDELTVWSEKVVKPKAELAFAGLGEYNQGDWCRFCKASALCRHRLEENTTLEEFQDENGKLKTPPILDNEEVGLILARAKNLAQWVEKLEKFALEEMVKGNVIPGWKLVEGRSNRVITDIDAAYNKLAEAGYKKAVLYEKKPISLSAVEQLITKEDYNQVLLPYIDKPKGKPTIALNSDKRPEYQVKNSAEEDFGGENTYKEAAGC